MLRAVLGYGFIVVNSVHMLSALACYLTYITSHLNFTRPTATNGFNCCFLEEEITPIIRVA